MPVKAELHSDPEKDHQGGNACQWIHLSSQSTSSTSNNSGDLKDDGFRQNEDAFFKVQMYCTLKHVDRFDFRQQHHVCRY